MYAIRSYYDPQDSPEKMKIIAKTNQYPFPYLYDETQVVAKAYRITSYNVCYTKLLRHH